VAQFAFPIAKTVSQIGDPLRRHLLWNTPALDWSAESAFRSDLIGDSFLKVHSYKTAGRIKEARQERFDFLGYSVLQKYTDKEVA
jgi:hypothetical protein